MTIDIEEFALTQTVVEDVNPKLFERIQPLYSRKVVITGPVLKKNRKRHPEMGDKYDWLANVCADPDYVCRNKRDAEIAICYKTIGEQRLRVTLWLKQRDSPMNVHNSVLSYRLFHKKELEREIKRGRVVYQRKSIPTRQDPLVPAILLTTKWWLTRGTNLDSLR